MPALAVMLPAAGGVVVALVGKRERLRDLLAIAFTAGTFGICAGLFPAVMLHGTRVVSRLPLFFGNFRIAADPLALLFALACSFLWLAATVYGSDYIRHEERRTRYHAFSLFTEAMTLGVFLASDFFVLFVFFELLSLFAYMLVIHNQEPASLAAGSKFFMMAVYGGLSLLFGILLYYAYAGTVGFNAIPGSTFLAGSACFIVAGFILGGTGVKAGMVPFHVWLPLAHPAAPSPASALLSGIMIKAGAFGVMRLVGTFGAVRHEGVALVTGVGRVAGVGERPIAGAANLHTLGWVIIVLGMATMLVGMVLALVQDNMKRLLAYSSISQMGYILVGLGCGGFLVVEGSMGLAGGIYHAINHTMFKGLLFLGAGAVLYSFGQPDMRRLGGLWRRMPVTTAVTCVAGLGIIGIPLFNGFVSKTLIHHAIVESLHLGGPWMRVVDLLFILAAAGTTCYVLKFLYFTFFKRPVEEAPVARARPTLVMEAAMAGLAAGVILLGVFPGVVMKYLVVPSLSAFGFLAPAGVEHMSELHIYTAANLVAILPALGIGIAAFLVAARWDLFRLKLPAQAGIDFYYQKAGAGFLRLCQVAAAGYARFTEAVLPRARSGLASARRGLQATQGAYRWSVLGFFRAARSVPSRLEGLSSYARAIAASQDVSFGIAVIALGVAALLLVVAL
jgi:hydrogenase-4 component B